MILLLLLVTASLICTILLISAWFAAGGIGTAAAHTDSPHYASIGDSQNARLSQVSDHGQVPSLGQSAGYGQVAGFGRMSGEAVSP